MTIKECYEQMGADYDEVLRRFPSDAFIQRFALKFPNDPSFPSLVKFLAEGNVQEAFRAAHTLKGVAQNLAFTQLAPLAIEITEILRAGTMEGTAPLMEELQKKYDLTIACISEVK